MKRRAKRRTGMAHYDAVIIGAGPNGLAAGNVLAEAGWHVLVLEGQDRIGGAVASDEAVHDGFIHDTFSSFYPLAAASPVLKAMHLDRFGLAWSHAPAVVGSPDPGGGWALIQHDPRDTAEGLEQLHPGDGDAWERMYRDWTHIGDCLVDALLTPFPPVRAGIRAALKLRKVGGFPVAKGGAGHLAAALAARLASLGGETRCQAEVTRIELAHGRAVGVRLNDGEIIHAARAVIADVSAPALYGHLVGWQQLPDRVRRQMRTFQFDPGTVKVDWALNGPVSWRDPPVTAPGTVHLTGSVDDLSQWMTQINSGLIPADAFLLIGQMTTADPNQVPRRHRSAVGVHPRPPARPLRRRRRAHHRPSGRHRRPADGRPHATENRASRARVHRPHPGPPHPDPTRPAEPRR